MGEVTAPLASRYRCNGCGNLTRFDVTTLRRTRAFHHYTVGGELEIEDVEVLEESTEDVSCRWCGHGREVETLPPGDPGDAGDVVGDDVDAASSSQVDQTRPAQGA